MSTGGLHSWSRGCQHDPLSLVKSPYQGHGQWEGGSMAAPGLTAFPELNLRYIGI